jgi:hypothetical protein
MKASTIKLAVASALLVLLTSCGPPARNTGKESGYYGDFNRASNALVSTPGMKITNSWLNSDITLEEFGFDVVTGDGQAVSISFSEQDPRQKFSRAQLAEVLAAEIELKAEPATNKWHESSIPTGIASQTHDCGLAALPWARGLPSFQDSRHPGWPGLWCE